VAYAAGCLRAMPRSMSSSRWASACFKAAYCSGSSAFLSFRSFRRCVNPCVRDSRYVLRPMQWSVSTRELHLGAHYSRVSPSVPPLVIPLAA
jgi:hypothetical protein